MKYLAVIACVLMLSSCVNKNETQLLNEQEFSYKQDGSDIHLFTIKNKNGMACQLTNFGARVVSLFAPDKNGAHIDVVVGYGSGSDFVNMKERFFGATIGRYGNRIGGATFTLNGEQFHLFKNNGNNHLHGGPVGFHRVVWTMEEQSENTITFRHMSAHMEDGYPGNVNVKVRFELSDDNELRIQYTASTDKPTILNLTNHTYFNLADRGKGSINNHELLINADYFTPLDSTSIPTGSIVKVEGTPFDFRSLTAIGLHMHDNNEQLKIGSGYDHNWVLNSGEKGLKFAAKVYEPESGRIMEVFTSEPGIQFYGGNFLQGTKGKYGVVYENRSAFCLETQHFPDTPNKPNFPQVTLLPGEEYHSICVYKFSNSDSK